MLLVRSKQNSSCSLSNQSCLLCSSWSRVRGWNARSLHVWSKWGETLSLFWSFLLKILWVYLQKLPLSISCVSMGLCFFLLDCMWKTWRVFPFLPFDRTSFYLHILTDLLVPVTAWWFSYHRALCSKVTIRPQPVSWWSNVVKWGNRLVKNLHLFFHRVMNKKIL